MIHKDIIFGYLAFTLRKKGLEGCGRNHKGYLKKLDVLQQIISFGATIGSLR